MSTAILIVLLTVSVAFNIAALGSWANRFARAWRRSGR